jgi:hypothetical protein
MKIIIKQIFPSSCHFLRVRTKYFLITPFANTFNLCSSVNIGGQVSHPYATSSVIIVLPSKGHQNYMLFADRNKFHVQKLNSLNCNSTFSVFSLFNTQTVQHITQTLTISFYIYDRCITFLMKASQVPSNSILNQSPAKTHHMLLTLGLHT